MIHRQRRARKGEAPKIHLGELMALWVYSEKFMTGTQLPFGTLLFATGEDDDLELQV
jgi:hypothetical protein